MRKFYAPFLIYMFICAISASIAADSVYMKAGNAGKPNAVKKDEEMRVKIAEKELSQMRIEERAIHLTVAVEEKCDDEFYSQFTEHLQRVSDLLWKITQGQFYIDRVSFKDNSWAGRIIVPKGAKNFALLSGKAIGVAAQCCEPNTNRWFVLCPGKPKSEIIVTHELLHGLAKLRDEDRCNCIMQGQTSGQIKPVCDKAAHKHKSKNCWDLLISRWPGTKCPNPEFKNASLPPKIQISAKEHQEKPDGTKEKILKIDELITRGILLIEARQYDNALAFFNKALTADPQAPAALYNIACIYAIKGNKEKALEYLKKALDCGFDDYELLLDDADFKSIKEDKTFGEMIEKCRKALPGYKKAQTQKLPESVSRNIAMDNEKEQLLKEEQQIEELHKQAESLLYGGKYKESLEICKKILLYRPNDKNAFYNMACACSLLGKTGDALGYLEKAVESGFSPLEYIKNDPALNNIRKEARYQKLTALVKEKEDGLPKGEIEPVLAPNYIRQDKNALENPVKELTSIPVSRDIGMFSYTNGRFVYFDGSSIVMLNKKGEIEKKVLDTLLRDIRGLDLRKNIAWAISADKLVSVNIKSGLVTPFNNFSIKESAGLAIMGRFLFIGDRKNRKIIKIDSRNENKVAEFLAPSEDIVDMAAFGKYLVVADGKDKAVYIITEDGYVILSIKLEFIPGGVASDGKTIWISGNNKIVQFGIDTKRNIYLSGKRTASVRYNSNEGRIALPWNMNRQKILGKIKTIPKCDIERDKWGQPSVSAIKVEVRAEIYDVQYFVWPHRVGSAKQIPKSILKEYLVDGELLCLKDPEIQKGAKWITRDGQEKDYYKLLHRAYQYATEHMYYARGGGWMAAPVALKRGSGTCSPNAFVFVAFCRASGIPARFQAGTRFRGSDPCVDNEFHRWSEVYIPGYGWVPVDSSSVGQNPTPARRANCFGHVPNIDLIMTLGGGGSDFFGWGYNAPKGGTADWFDIKLEK